MMMGWVSASGKKISHAVRRRQARGVHACIPHANNIHRKRTWRFPEELLRGMRRGVWMRRLERRTSSVMTAASLVSTRGANQGRGPMMASTGGWSRSSNSRANSLMLLGWVISVSEGASLWCGVV